MNLWNFRPLTEGIEILWHTSCFGGESVKQLKVCEFANSPYYDISKIPSQFNISNILALCMPNFRMIWQTVSDEFVKRHNVAKRTKIANISLPVGRGPLDLSRQMFVLRSPTHLPNLVRVAQSIWRGRGKMWLGGHISCWPGGGAIAGRDIGCVDVMVIIMSINLWNFRALTQGIVILWHTSCFVARQQNYRKFEILSIRHMTTYQNSLRNLTSATSGHHVRQTSAWFDKPPQTSSLKCTTCPRAHKIAIISFPVGRGLSESRVKTFVLRSSTHLPNLVRVAQSIWRGRGKITFEGGAIESMCHARVPFPVPE